MKISSLLLKTLLFLTPFLIVSDRAESFEELLAALEKQTYDFVQEKVYLHLDKPFYSKGDNLWFKAYTVAGPNHTPTPLSQNLYVELIGPDSKVLKRSTIFMEKGLGHGDFELADSLEAGNYTVRAYTNWMRNFDEEFFFKKQVSLLNPLGSKNDQSTVSEISINFFPEGGELIANIPTNVAFEVKGMGEEVVEGQILDDQGKVITTFKSEHEGVGSFALNPEVGKKYSARIDGQSESFELPASLDKGLIMSVDNVSDTSQISVIVKSTASKTEDNEAYLVAHTRGIVGFATKLEWKGAMARIKIPKQDLTSGVVHLTLFNKNWLPESERLIFSPLDPDLIQVDLTTDKTTYKARDSTAVKLKVTNQSGQPIRGFFSLNVYDAVQIAPSAFEENIMSSLLLTSDLNGQIRNPVQYFKSGSGSARNLDLIMMTQGWRRFLWKDVLNEEFPDVNHKVEQGFDVTGKLTIRGKKPVAKGVVKQIGNFNGLPNLNEATTSGSGNFEMKGIHYYEGVSLVQGADKKGKNNVNLELDPMMEQNFKNEVNLPQSSYGKVMDADANFLIRSRERLSIDSAFSFENVTDLGTVVVQGTKNNQISANISRGQIFNRGEFSLSVSDIMSNGQKFVSALYVLQGRVPGITIINGPSAEPILQMTRKVESFSNPNPPTLFLIDDAPADISAVSNMPAERIERIEVLKGMRATSIYGPAANGGAIAFYTKTSDEYDAFYRKLTENGVNINKNVLSLGRGYYKSRQFYAPNYKTEIPEHIRPDRRDLIHWEPMIQTNESGEATIKFFNADLPTTIQVQLEGIWEGGLPITASTTYKVTKK